MWNFARSKEFGLKGTLETRKAKKVPSIAKRYFTIFSKCIDYCPSLPDDPENNAQPVEYTTVDEDMTVKHIEQNAKK